LTNTGNVALEVLVTDVLPGGFSYVAGSANVGEPGTPEDGTLTWEISISPDESVTITYQAKIDSGLIAGTYKNLATCREMGRGQELDGETLAECDPVDSSVTIGQVFSYGGSLTPMVLGASTEVLPATGSETSLLLFALIVGGFGVYTKIRASRLGRRKYAKN